MSTPAKWYPRLQGVVPAPADEAIRVAYDSLYTLRDKLSSLASSIPPAGPTLAQIKAAIQSTGPYALNVTNLEGILAQSQNAIIPVFTSLPSGSGYVKGEAVIVNGQLYVWNGIKFEPIGFEIFVGTHAVRQSMYNANSFSIGSGFYENDTNVFLLDLPVGNINVWVPIVATPIEDIHANRANYTPVYYPNGTPYWESDRTVSYITAPLLGVCNTNGANVTWVSGNNFNNTWIGYLFQIENNNNVFVSYPIVAVANNNAQLTLGFSAGTSNNANFAMPSAQWKYQSGVMTCSSNNGNNSVNLPNDLGTADDGFQATEPYFSHAFRWFGNGSAWDWWPGSEESNQFGFFPGTPDSRRWAPCTGANTTMCSNAGSVSIVATPNYQPDNNGSIAFLQLLTTGSAGTVNNATSPTWSNNNNNYQTDPATQAWANSASTDNDSDGGVNVIAVPGNILTTLVSANPHQHPLSNNSDFASHFHTLSNNNAILNPPSETNNGLPRRTGIPIYLRR